MGSAGEGTVEHRPSQLKCHQHCLFALRKELKFILATHIILTDVSGLVEAPAYNQVERGGGRSAPPGLWLNPPLSLPHSSPYNLGQAPGPTIINQTIIVIIYFVILLFTISIIMQDQMHLARIVLW